jgi:hypothetical protein
MCLEQNDDNLGTTLKRLETMYNFKIDDGETNEETILLLGICRSFSILQKLFCSKHISE